MMTSAYDEMYLDDAMNNLGDMFDYAVNDCGIEGDDIYVWFFVSEIAKQFGRGNPKYIAGLSGSELASEINFRTKRMRLDVIPTSSIDKSPEYWVGWILAYYQWFTGLRFIDLYRNGLTFKRVLSLYPTLHEADITKFVDVANDIISNNKKNNNSLKEIRMARGLTQSSLAEKSGVSLRMIQLYEQGRQDIKKAQAISIVHIARVLGCEVEDLLE
ncbi:MAG: helix-turn-helix transcriptional regulator [Oscillospiraceae bacterium]|nr:helix-turn-helix transcriptional regulator [Oscillospiraceae bacterium]